MTLTKPFKGGPEFRKPSCYKQRRQVEVDRVTVAVFQDSEADLGFRGEDSYRDYIRSYSNNSHDIGII